MSDSSKTLSKKRAACFHAAALALPFVLLAPSLRAETLRLTLGDAVGRALTEGAVEYKCFVSRLGQFVQ